MATEVRESVGEAVVPGTGFTKAHQLFRETVRRFVDTEINPHVDQWEEDELFPAHELFKKAGDLGLLGLSYPEEYGGAGADYWYNMAMAEELARCRGGAIPMAMGVQTDMATPALNQYGSHELKKQFLEPAIRGDAVCSIAVTEPGAGSDVASIRTRADRVGDDYVINGSKMYITNGVPRSSRRWAIGPATRPSWFSRTRACRSAIGLAKKGRASSTRCSSSRTSG